MLGDGVGAEGESKDEGRRLEDEGRHGSPNAESQKDFMNGSPKTFRFERLEVWQQARLLNKKIYVCSRQFPESERFGLVSQIRRASVSISSNIAEGAGRNSDTDFAHFLEIAYGSLMEAISQLYLALDENYITQVQLDDITSDAHSLSAQIIALSKSLGRKPRKNS